MTKPLGSAHRHWLMHFTATLELAEDGRGDGPSVFSDTVGTQKVLLIERQLVSSPGQRL